MQIVVVIGLFLLIVVGTTMASNSRAAARTKAVEQQMTLLNLKRNDRISYRGEYYAVLVAASLSFSDGVQALRYTLHGARDEMPRYLIVILQPNNYLVEFWRDIPLLDIGNELTPDLLVDGRYYHQLQARGEGCTFHGESGMYDYESAIYSCRGEKNLLFEKFGLVDRILSRGGEIDARYIEVH